MKTGQYVISSKKKEMDLANVIAKANKDVSVNLKNAKGSTNISDVVHLPCPCDKFYNFKSSDNIELEWYTTGNPTP